MADLKEPPTEEFLKCDQCKCTSFKPFKKGYVGFGLICIMCGSLFETTLLKPHWKVTLAGKEKK